MWVACSWEVYERQDFLLDCQTFQFSMELKCAAVCVWLRSEQRSQALMSSCGFHWVLAHEKHPGNQHLVWVLIFPLRRRRRKKKRRLYVLLQREVEWMCKAYNDIRRNRIVDWNNRQTWKDFIPWSECPPEVPVFRWLHGSPEFLNLLIYTAVYINPEDPTRSPGLDRPAFCAVRCAPEQLRSRGAQAHAAAVLRAPAASRRRRSSSYTLS